MRVDKSKWQKKTIGQIGKVISGSTPRTDNPSNWNGGTHNWVTPAELKGEKYYGSTQKKITDTALETTNLTLMPVGTVLLSSRAPIGKVAITTEPMYCNQGFKNIECNACIHNEYLYYYLKYNNEELNRRGNGVTFKEISKKIVEQFPVIVPSIEEQKGIAAELDALQAIIDGYKAQLHDLDELIKSIFNNTFGDIHSNPYNFDIKLMQDVCSKITDGTHNPPKFVDSGIPFIFVSNIANYEISYLAKKHIDDASYNELWKSTPVEVGDVVYTSVGSYGNPAIVRTDKKFMFQRHIALLKPKHDVIESEYLKWFLISPSGKEQADNKAIGAAQKTLNLKAIKSFKIIVPPKEKQRSFTAQVEILEKQKTLLQEQQADAEQLMAERMQYYFS